ncbi:MAG: pimeloyl-ACP methyl ester carboxylesterase [Arenicella sp.]|jgi:pimeloyl-ACP methyl ester carboxylesterase
MKHTNIHPAPDQNTTGLGDLDNAVSAPPVWLRDVLSVPREEGYVEVDGVNIHYFRWGDRSKPAILMLHGFLAHSRCFAFIAPYLAADYHVVAYDFSGMGDSDARDSYSLQVRIEELLGVAEQTGLSSNNAKPIIVAHSYGGHVGVAALRAHPEKFSGIIICDLMILRPSVWKETAGLFKPPGNQNSKRKNRVYPDYETAKQRFVLSPPQEVEQPELFDFMAFHSLTEVAGGWSWKFDPSVFNREPGSEKNFLRTAEKLVTAPGRKAIIYGKQSLLFTDDSAAYVQETIAELDAPNIPIIGIPHARHHLMLDQPIAFVSALRTVLACWQDE